MKRYDLEEMIQKMEDDDPEEDFRLNIIIYNLAKEIQELKHRMAFVSKILIVNGHEVKFEGDEK